MEGEIKFIPPQEEEEKDNKNENKEEEEEKEDFFFTAGFTFQKEPEHGENMYSLILQGEHAGEFIMCGNRKLIINYTDGSRSENPIFDFKIFFDAEKGKKVASFQIE